MTPDGWVLNMFRIPHGKYRHASPGPRPVVLLHHGITLDSACFVPLGANQSLALILADAGASVPRAPLLPSSMTATATTIAKIGCARDKQGAGGRARGGGGGI